MIHTAVVLRLEGISHDDLNHFYSVRSYLEINTAVLQDLGNPMESINSGAPGVTARTEEVQRPSRLDTQGSGGNHAAPCWLHSPWASLLSPQGPPVSFFSLLWDLLGKLDPKSSVLPFFQNHAKLHQRMHCWPLPPHEIHSAQKRGSFCLAFWEQRS